MNSAANNTHTTTDHDDEETAPQRSFLVWVEDWELRQQEIERLAVEMFLESKLEQKDH